MEDSIRKKFPIHKKLANSSGRKVNVTLNDGTILSYTNILEYCNSRLHLNLVFRTEDDQSESISIPKDLIRFAERYVLIMDKFMPIKLNTKRLLNIDKKQNKKDSDI